MMLFVTIFPTQRKLALSFEPISKQNNNNMQVSPGLRSFRRAMMGRLESILQIVSARFVVPFSDVTEETSY